MAVPQDFGAQSFLQNDVSNHFPYVVLTALLVYIDGFLFMTPEIIVEMPWLSASVLSDSKHACGAVLADSGRKGSSGSCIERQ